MPYPNEHSARVRDPDDFISDSIRRKNIRKGIDIIIGKLKDGDGSMVIQAYRFDKDVFTASEARKWCKDHDVKYILFEEAKQNNIAMFIKSISAEVKDLDEKGLVKFYFSYFGNLDSDGDITEKGAFAKTISDWKNASKKRIRHFKNHRWDQTPGVIQDLYEEEKGAVAISKLILGTQCGRETYEEYKAGAITEHSFGYDIIESFMEEVEGGKIQHLKELKLEEVSSLTSWGANSMTDVLDVKNEDQVMKLLEKLEALKKGDFSDQYFEKLEHKIAAVHNVLLSLRRPEAFHLPESIETALKHSTLFNI